MNMFKSNGGFTLVELIVVIAILAILAGVAVPAYSGYIANANKSADDAALQTIETAMTSALSMSGKNLADYNTYFDIESQAGSKKITFAKDAQLTGENKVWDNYVAFGGDTEVTFKYYTGATIDANGVITGTAPTK